MAATKHVSPLRLWSLATFHAVSFVAAIALTLHRLGSLRDRLASLNTALGFGFFLLLWVTTWFATRTGLRHLDAPGESSESSASLVASAVVGGGWNGVFIFVALALFVGALFNPAVLLFGIFGGLIAFVIGGMVGFLYGLVDAALLGLSAALFRWAITERTEATD